MTWSEALLAGFLTLLALSAIPFVLLGLLVWVLEGR